MDDKRPLELLVDFGSTLDDELLPAALPKDLPAEGAPVFLYDLEGSACYGVVERTDENFVWCRPDLATWFTDEAPQGSNEPEAAISGSVPEYRLAASDLVQESNSGYILAYLNTTVVAPVGHGAIAVYAKVRLVGEKGASDDIRALEPA